MQDGARPAWPVAAVPVADTGCYGRCSSMPALALGLVLCAAVVHAGWNVVAKQAGGDARFALLASLAVVVVWAPVGGVWAWREAGGYGGAQWGLIIASGVIHVAYFVTLLRGYRLADLSVVYPVARGLGPFVTAVIATTCLGERLGLAGWCGVVGIVVGVVIIAGGWRPLASLGRGDLDPAGRTRLGRGIGYGVLTGLCIAAYTVVDGYAVKWAGISPILIDYLGNVVRIPVGILVVGASGWSAIGSLPSYARQQWRSALLIGIGGPLGYVLVLFAATMAPLSQVAPLREVSMLFAAVLGGSLLREGEVGMRLLGAGCVAAGVMALAFKS
jgi:drug/metabolite transporter (DMT)-like permease